MHHNQHSYVVNYKFIEVDIEMNCEGEKDNHFSIF